MWCLLYPQPLPERRLRDLYLSQSGFFKQNLNKNGTNENGERVIIMRKNCSVYYVALIKDVEYQFHLYSHISFQKLYIGMSEHSL